MSESSERRDELLGNIVTVLLNEGLAELSLRPLADKVGSSARLLIYHFGSKENLVKSALEVVHTQAEESLKALALRKRPDNLKASLLLFWDWATDASNQRYFRLMFEADGLSMHRKNTASDAFRDDGSAIWLQMIDRITASLPKKERAEGRSTLIMAALNGLLQDLFSTGDKDRTRAGLNYLIRMITREEKS